MVPLVCVLQWYFSPRISFRFSFNFWLHFSYYIVCACDRDIHFYSKSTVYNKICKLTDSPMFSNISFQAVSSIIDFSTKAVTRNYFDGVFYPFHVSVTPAFPSFLPLSAPFTSPRIHLGSGSPAISPAGSGGHFLAQIRFFGVFGTHGTCLLAAKIVIFLLNIIWKLKHFCVTRDYF